MREDQIKDFGELKERYEAKEISWEEFLEEWRIIRKKEPPKQEELFKMQTPPKLKEIKY